MTSPATSAQRLALALTAVVLVLSGVSAIALYDGVEHVLVSAPKVIYVELFAPAVAVTAAIDLVRRQPAAGNLTRGVLGLIGLLALAWFRNVIQSDWRLVLAIVVYVLVMAIADMEQLQARRSA